MQVLESKNIFGSVANTPPQILGTEDESGVGKQEELASWIESQSG
jgi:hypothetical protein